MKIKLMKEKLCDLNRNSIMMCPQGIDTEKLYDLTNDDSTLNFIHLCEEYNMNCARVSFDICFEKLISISEFWKAFLWSNDRATEDQTNEFYVP